MLTMPRKAKSNFITDRDYSSDGYKPVHPATYDLGVRFPELSYKTFKNKQHCFVYDNRSVESCVQPIAKLIRNGNYSTVEVNGEKLYTGSVRNCLAHIHQLLLLGVLKNGKVCEPL